MRVLMFLVALGVGGVITSGCAEDIFDIRGEELLVVRAFIYAGEPVEEVELTLTLALDSESEPEPVSDAEVALTRDGVSYSLIPTSQAPGFYRYPGDDLVVEVGDVWDLEVRWSGQVVTGRSVVPEPPMGLHLSSDIMEIPELTGGPRFGRGLFGDPIVARWENPTGGYFFMTVDNLEEDPEILPTTELFVNRPIRFTSEPVTADSMFVNPVTLTHYGAHEVTLFQVNEEYADLYEGRRQDTRDLNEPPTNIVGGLGVFSAFAGTKVYFTAVKEGQGS